MKRSRRVILTMMGTAAIGTVSTGFVRPSGCGPGFTAEPSANGEAACRAIHGGFGGAALRLHGHGHAHGGG